MGDLNNYSVNTVNSGAPDWNHGIGYWQSGRNGSVVNHHFEVTLKMTEGSFGYGTYMLARVTVNGTTSGWVGFGGGNTWGLNETRTAIIDTSVGAGSGGGTYSASVEWYCNNGGATSPNATVGGSVTVSVWNTAPQMLGSITLNPVAGIVAENLSSVTLNGWGANDNESTVTYTVQKETDQSGSWPVIASGISVGTPTYTDNISSLAQGHQVRYAVSCFDTSAAQSGFLFSGFITKNTFTPATLGSSASLTFGATSLALTVTGAANTQGSTAFTYSLACLGITITNPITVTAGAVTIPISMTELKALFSGSNYVGNLSFTLTTTNAFGSSGTSTKTIAVDLRVNPLWTTPGLVTSGTYNVGGTLYYIPNRKAITVTWNAATDQLGAAAIKYDVAVSIAGGAFTNVTGCTDLSVLTASFFLTAVALSSTCVVRVTSKATYGNYLAASATQIMLNYYNPSTITYGTITPLVIPVQRAQTTAIITGLIKLNTSITTGLTITNPTYQYNGGAVTNSGWVAGTFTFTTTLSGLLDTSIGTYILTVKDTASIAIEGTLGALSTILSQAINSYIPMLALRSNGVGINSLPDGISKLTVGGKVSATDTITTTQLVSNIAIGTPPLIVTSTTVVPNLNSALHGGYAAGNATGNIPVSNGVLNTNLNSDMLGGFRLGGTSANGGTWPHIPVVKTDGVMEIGKYIDFHDVTNDGIDSPIRMTSSAGQMFLTNPTHGASQILCRVWSGSGTHATNTTGAQAFTTGFTPSFIRIRASLTAGAGPNSYYDSDGSFDGVQHNCWFRFGDSHTAVNTARIILMHSGMAVTEAGVVFNATGFTLNWDLQGNPSYYIPTDTIQMSLQVWGQ